jgi:FkbM family methyltransferase
MKYDFIEIGTSDFETEIQECSEDAVGLSIEPIARYLENLPNKKNVTKINCAVSNYDGKIKVFYLSEDNIKKHNYPNFLKGCNAVGSPHPALKGFVFGIVVPDELISCDEVEVKTLDTIFKEYNVDSINHLKIDTEGHDCTILDSYYDICVKNNNLLAEKITFENNELTNQDHLSKILEKFKLFSYSFVTGYNSILQRVC